MTSRLTFFAPAAVLAAWATVMMHTFATGHLNRLLSPMFRTYVVVAAVVLLLLAILYLVLYQPEPIVATPAMSPRSPLRQLGRWLMLLLPLLAAAVLSPAALSSTTMANRAAGPNASYAMPTADSATKEEVQQALAADPNQPVPMEVTDLILLAKSSDQIAKFAGRPVRVVGLWVPGSPPRLARWIMWCCAADAQPASVQLSGTIPGDFKADQWLEVVGKAAFPSTLGQAVPTIEVQSVTPTKEPDEPYLSP
jgi:uncharacterized repeat protein (TIGR03943 family)